MRNNDPVDSKTATTKPRRGWSAPRLTRFRAGEAELGANPIVPEGAFAAGS